VAASPSNFFSTQGQIESNSEMKKEKKKKNQTAAGKN
jgi:hypothetical protein